MSEHVLRCFTKKAVARLPEDLIPEDVDLRGLVGTEVRGAPGLRVLEAWRNEKGDVYVAMERPVSDSAGDRHDDSIVTTGPDAGEKLSLYWF